MLTRRVDSHLHFVVLVTHDDKTLDAPMWHWQLRLRAGRKTIATGRD